jgi:hypothetical protein
MRGACCLQQLTGTQLGSYRAPCTSEPDRRTALTALTSTLANLARKGLAGCACTDALHARMPRMHPHSCMPTRRPSPCQREGRAPDASRGGRGQARRLLRLGVQQGEALQARVLLHRLRLRLLRCG